MMISVKIVLAAASCLVTAKTFAKDLPNPVTPVVQCQTFDDEVDSSSRPGKATLRLVERLGNTQTYSAVFEMNHRFPDQGYQVKASNFIVYTKVELSVNSTSEFVVKGFNSRGQLGKYSIDLASRAGSVDVRHQLENVMMATLDLRNCKAQNF
jgi:hypothetical protein